MVSIRAVQLARLVFPFVVLVVSAAGGCSSEQSAERTPLVVAEGCQPLLAGEVADEVSRGPCMLPYPSDFYRIETPNGPRIVLTGEAKPRKTTGEVADIHDVVAMDGFSLIPSIVATLPSHVTREGLPSLLDDPNASATPASATVILDTETGSLVPHYTDKIDRGVDPEHEPLVLRPFRPLEPKRRYVVALKGVRLADGSGLAPPPEGFRRLRDREADPAIDAMRERFDRDVFDPLERAGIARRELQLAWDFTTGSEEEPRTDMLRVRELTLAWLASNEPTVTITEVTPGTDRIWRKIVGTVSAPLFLDAPGPGGRLFRGPDGKVAQNGTTTFEFTANVPIAVRDRFEPGRALAYGHGFFGGRAELDGNGAQTIAEGLAAVEFGIDWWGMAKEDLGHVGNVLGEDPAHGIDFNERVHQAMANWLVMTSAIRGPLARVPELVRPQEGEGVVTGPGGESNAGQPLYDPSFVAYFGASMAHILGGTFVALDPNISRAVLNVGGGGFSHMMPRAGPFGTFALVLDAAFRDELVSQAYQAMAQRVFDRIDPVTYAPLVEARPLPDSPPDRRVLMQIGLGDPAVPNAGSFLHARALGLKLTTPSPLEVFGLEPATDPSQSAITLFDYHVDTSGSALPEPLPPNEVHEAVRVNPAAVRQMAEFLRPGGTVIHPCDGPCDPE